LATKREDVYRRRVDFSDVRSGRRLAPVHPGEILRDEFLTPMGIGLYVLANDMKVPRSRVNDIALGRYFGTSPEFWLNLQARYDLDVAGRSMRWRIEQEVRPRAA